MSGRRPTIEEAVSHLSDSPTNQYQRECIRFWREKYGDVFVDSISRTFSAKQKKGRK